MLAARVATGTSLIALTVAVLWFDERLAPFFPLWFVATAILQGLAALELAALLQQTSARPSANTVFAGTLAILAANWFPHLLPWFSPGTEAASLGLYDPLRPIHALAWPMLTFSTIVMMTFVGQSAQYRRPGGTMATISGTVLAVAYVGVLGSFIVQLRWLDGPLHGLVPLIFLIATAKGADIGAYTMGRLAGRHKLWPRLSPNKTIEGAIGGMAFGILASLGSSAVTGSLLGAPTLDWKDAIGFGIVVGTAAQLGDLMESMIKRDCERKDASAALPGFGGVLDVVDSLLFAGPVAFGYWLAFGP